MTALKQKHSLAKLPTKEAADGKPPAGGRPADPAPLTSMSDIVHRCRDVAHRGPNLLPPRLVVRNGIIHIAHGRRRLSTRFEALPSQDFREHKGAQAKLRSFTDALVRSRLTFK